MVSLQDVDENNKAYKEDENSKGDKGETGEDHREVENMEVHTEEDKGAGKPGTSHNVFCIICMVRLTSRDQAETHFDGSRHKKAVALLLGIASLNVHHSGLVLLIGIAYSLKVNQNELWLVV